EQSPAASIVSGVGYVSPQGGEIVGTDKSRAVRRIACAARPRIPWASITVRLVLRSARDCSSLNLALPWPLGTMWRHQHPFPRKRIEPAMRHLIDVLEFHPAQVGSSR